MAYPTNEINQYSKDWDDLLNYILDNGIVLRSSGCGLIFKVKLKPLLWVIPRSKTYEVWVANKNGAYGTLHRVDDVAALGDRSASQEAMNKLYQIEKDFLSLKSDYKIPE